MPADSRLSGRVLLVGKRARVLDQLAHALTARGLSVREETDVDRARTQLDGLNFDIVVVGRAISAPRRDALAKTMRERNPRLRVLDGMAPITGLLVAQVEEALTSPGPDARIVGLAALETLNKRVVLVLRRPAIVDVVLLRLDAFYRAHEIKVYSGPLERGRNYLPIRRGRYRTGERYVVVRAAGETSVHPAP